MDDAGNIFRRLFNLPPHPRKDELRGNRWDDGPNDSSVFYPPRNRRASGDEFDSMFDLFHGNMFQQMESLHRQMEDMMKNFGAVDFPSSEMDPPPLRELPPGEQGPQGPHTDGNVRVWFGTPSPFFHFSGSGPERKSPRDFMLKDDDEPRKNLPALPPATPPPSQPGPGSSRDFPIFFGPRWGQAKREEKKDSDLDGQLSDKQLVDIITNELPQQPPAVSEPRMPSSWGKSVSITRVQKPDGKVEERRLVRDSSGRVESSVTKSMDGQSHILTTVTGQDGNTQTTETLLNMDEKDKDKFQSQWQDPPRQPSPADSVMPPVIDRRDKDLFSKLFG